MRRIPAPVPPLSPSPAIGEILAAVLPCLSLFLFPWLSLSHTHIHTHTYIPSYLPASHLSLSLPFFPQPSPFSLRLPDEVSALDCWLLAAQFASALFLSLSFSTHTHTHTHCLIQPSAQTHMHAPHHTSHE